MKFKYVEKSKLPPLAWCAFLNKSDDVMVLHGPSVECKEDFFVAGVWDGDFEEGGFDLAHFACCTGGSVNKTKRGGVKFSTPNHLQDKLLSIIVGDTLYVSNSLPLLLVVSGCELDVNYPHYEEDLCNSIFGLRKAKRTTKLRNDKTINIHLCCNVEVDKSLIIVEERKCSGLTFANYQEYHEKTLAVLKDLKLNATDEKRKTQYGMVSTISKGYDAPAASALVHDVGCNKVITFNRPAKYAPDCGTEIARMLGFHDIIEGDGNLYLKNDEQIEAEACATGEIGTAIAFAAFGNEFQDCLFFMGTRGDSLFERLHGNVNDDYDFSDGNGYTQSNSSFTESALKTNSIIVHIPLIGGDRWSDLARISNSAEMKAFSIADEYDRPVSRRILEEKGIPREAFGSKKSGAGISFHFDTFARMRKKMSPASFSSLKNFKQQLKRNKLSTMWYAIRYYANEAPIYINYVCAKLHIPLNLSTHGCGKMSSPLSSLLILWGVDVMMKRYKQQLNE